MFTLLRSVQYAMAKRRPQKTPLCGGVCGALWRGHCYSSAHVSGLAGSPTGGGVKTNGGRSLHSSGCGREAVNCLCAS